MESNNRVDLPSAGLLVLGVVAFVLFLVFGGMFSPSKERIMDPSKELIKKIEAKYFDDKSLNFKVERDYLSTSKCDKTLILHKNVKVYRGYGFDKKLYLSTELVEIPVSSLSPKYKELILTRYNQEESACENKLKQDEVKRQLKLVK